MIPFPLKSVFSLSFAIRSAELALAIALALALADLARQLLPAPADGEQPGLAAPGAAASGQPAPGVLSGAAAARDLSPAVLGLFGQAQGGAAAFAAGEVRETDLDLTLKGILASRAGARKLALVAQGEATEKVYRVGDRIAGAEITHIGARRLILLRNGASEALTLETAEPRRGSFSN